jgi:outer membrane lipoprotein SlyB
MRVLILSLALVGLLPLTASAADNGSARRYGTTETLSVQNARLGEVLMVRSVDIKSDKRLNAGSAIGAAVGYASVRGVNSSYRSASRIAAGTIGGVAGTAIQNGVSKRRGVEVYFRDLESGKVIAIVQADDLPICAGQQVFLTGRGSQTRVVPIQSGEMNGLGGQKAVAQ